MNERDFIYWLQCKLEIGDTKTLNEIEVQVIKDHINLVLKKETPVRLPLIISDPSMKPGEIKYVPSTTIPAYCRPNCSCLNCSIKKSLGGITC